MAIYKATAGSGRSEWACVVGVDQAVARLRTWLALEAPGMDVATLSAGMAGLNRFLSLCGLEAVLTSERGRPVLRVLELETDGTTDF